MSEENSHTEAWGENGIKHLEEGIRDAGDRKHRSHVSATGPPLGEQRENGAETLARPWPILFQN